MGSLGKLFHGGRGEHARHDYIYANSQTGFLETTKIAAFQISKRTISLYFIAFSSTKDMLYCLLRFESTKNSQVTKITTTLYPVAVLFTERDEYSLIVCCIKLPCRLFPS
jgi:hypothetical protein